MFHFKQGVHTKQGHKSIPEGMFEEEQGRKGFFGQVSHLLRRKPSTRWTKIEGELKPHLYDVVKMPQKWNEWQRLFYNNDAGVYNYWISPETADLKTAYKNSDGDTIYFCHMGSGEVLTEYGLLSYRKGHYIVIPKSIPHTLVPYDASQFLVIESKTSAYREPDRGMVGRNAFYDSEAICRPDLEKKDAFQKAKNISVTEMKIRHDGKHTTFFYEEDLYDIAGWKGDLWPFTLHCDDLMPLLSARVHLPPSAHCTFVANGFVICTFLPRPLESDADALKVPFYHQNIDYDEILFYHDGNFFSRDNLHAGMITLHPAGFPHGPHPKAMAGINTKTHTDEYAVMIDTWSKLVVDENIAKVEVGDYWKSWMKK